MPFYTYKCSNENCSTWTEAMRKIEDRDVPPDPCPSCNSEMRRALDIPGLVWAPTAGGYR